MKSSQTLDVLFLNPRDLVAAVPYVKSISHASVLREAGMKVDMIAPAPSGISRKEIMKIMETDTPKIVCLSSFPSTLPDTYQTILLIKERFPGMKIIIEGYHVNADPGIILEMGADYGLLGDAEYTMLELCSALLENKEVDHSAAGLAVNNNGELIVNKPAVIQDIDALPVPAFDLLPIGKYYSASTNKRIMYLFTTRGCPYDCSFCASAPQRNYRYLSTENAMKQIGMLVNVHKVKWIEFMDLTFTIHKNRTIELCQAIVDSGLKFEWGCETRADLLDEDIVKVMRAAGCKKITMGVEAGNKEVRYRTGKKIDDETFMAAFDLCRKYGIRTMANFILGHPGETEEQVLESIRFAKRLNPFNVFFVRMTPLPDVDIYKSGVARGEINKDIWTRYMKGEVPHPIYYTPSISPDRLNKLYSKAFRDFYFRWYSVKNYLPLFLNVKFMFKSLGVFNRIAFGDPVFK